MSSAVLVQVKGFGFALCCPKVVVDGGLQIADAGVTASPDALRRDLGEEKFDEVQP